MASAAKGKGSDGPVRWRREKETLAEIVLLKRGISMKKSIEIEKQEIIAESPRSALGKAS
ncbi:MAG TPA: hypothetical protein VFD00_05305 [Thermoclostridium sp.]|nr:hypothetical protein [Thermoclostridium sp.]